MATEAHTEHPGGKEPFPPFNKENFASQLVWLVVFFVALYVIIARMAIPRLGGIIEARSERIDGDMAEAKRLKLPALWLFTNKLMTENLALYAHIGFVETHRTVEHGYDRVYMRLSI